jgi:cytochrome b subunit of formate dehydrogenase
MTSASEPESFVRMTLGERVQHWVLIASFTLLVLTGLPLVVYEWGPLERLFPIGSAFHLRGLVHRVAAVVLIGLSAWHLGYILITKRGREIAHALRFRRKDASDAFEVLMHNLGITAWLYRRGVLHGWFFRHPYWLFAESPRYGRYNFIEKFEYLAVVWGSFAMISTGFFLWNVELAMRIFPRYVFDVLTTIHGYEAILAFLAVLVWHMYNVHFAPGVFPMSKVWLTGRISRKRLMEDHPLEYEEIVARGKETI